MTQDMSEEGFLLVETSRSLSHLSTTPLCGQWSAGRGLRTPPLFSSSKHYFVLLLRSTGYCLRFTVFASSINIYRRLGDPIEASNLVVFHLRFVSDRIGIEDILCLIS